MKRPDCPFPGCQGGRAKCAVPEADPLDALFAEVRLDLREQGNAYANLFDANNAVNDARSNLRCDPALARASTMEAARALLRAMLAIDREGEIDHG